MLSAILRFEVSAEPFSVDFDSSDTVIDFQITRENRFGEIFGIHRLLCLMLVVTAPNQRDL